MAARCAAVTNALFQTARHRCTAIQLHCSLIRLLSMSRISSLVSMSVWIIGLELAKGDCTTLLPLWPLPQNCSIGTQEAALPAACESLSINVAGSSGPGLDCVRAGTGRLQVALFGAECQPGSSSKASITITVDNTTLWPPIRPGQFDESFVLSAQGPGPSVVISAPTAAGALHALRLLGQLLSRSDGNIVSMQGLPLSVSDAPLLSHRGIMMDTARHFLPIETLERVVDGASASGMNALHLHLTDAESFPLQVPALPELAAKGAYSSKATYSAAALSGLVQYASDRGLVIIPEVDVPGHSYSWGLGYPNLTASCPGYEHNINNIPLNPAVQFAADALQATLEQVAAIFPSQLIHIGVSWPHCGVWYACSKLAWCKQCHCALGMQPVSAQPPRGVLDLALLGCCRETSWCSVAGARTPWCSN